MEIREFESNFKIECPLDIVENIVECNEWIFDRRDDHEIAVQVPGSWCDYNLHFSWDDRAEAMHFTCAFDMRVADHRRPLVHELLALINDRLWLGHFSMWNEDGIPLFRHAMPLRGAQGPASGQIEDLMHTAITECERFYPAFQYVVWGGKKAHEAFNAAIIDTVGEA